MEIKNNGNVSILDYLKTGNGEQVTSNSNNNFQEIFEQNRSTDSKKYQFDSQKHYLKDRVSNSNEKISNKMDNTKKDINKKDTVVKNDDVLTNETNEVKDKPVDEVEKTTKPESTDKVEDEKDTKKSELDTEKVKKLAELLNVSEEQILATIETMNISLEDLANPEIAKDFLVAINNLTSKVDLLSLENVKQKLVAIKEIANAESTEELSDEQIDKLISDALGATTEIVEETSENQLNQNTQGQSTDSTTKTVQNTATTEEPDLFTELEVSIEPETDTNTQSVATNDVNVENTAITGVAANVEKANTVQATGIDTNAININNDLRTNSQTSFLNEVSKTTMRSSVDTENILKQISEAMKVEIKGEVSNEIKITLRPQHLGDVTLKIVTDNGTITAQFEAQNQRVKEIIEANFNQLKSSLEEQGISVSNLEVNVSQQDQNNGATTDFSQNGGDRRNNSGQLNGDGLEGADIPAEVILEESVAVGSRSSFKA